MKALRILVFATVILQLVSCVRDIKPCGCVPPPQQSGNWKMTERFGGIVAGSVPLTEDQKNSVLTLMYDGTYNCRNNITGVISTGTYMFANFNSIYGDRQRVVFSPKLPILSDDYSILMDSPGGTLKFGDNLTDGYYTIFTRQ